MSHKSTKKPALILFFAALSYIRLCIITIYTIPTDSSVEAFLSRSGPSAFPSKSFSSSVVKRNTIKLNSVRTSFKPAVDIYAKFPATDFITVDPSKLTVTSSPQKKENKNNNNDGQDTTDSKSLTDENNSSFQSNKDFSDMNNENYGFSAYPLNSLNIKLSAKEKTIPYPKIDPFALVKGDLQPFSNNIKDLVDTQNPLLSNAATHFFEKRHGKRFRPTICLLVSRALQETAKSSDESDHNNENDNVATQKKMMTKETIQDVYKKQLSLAQITEMIHVASLIHDDVLDEADTRRGDLSVHKLYNNKVAVLAGDYLLARASVLLARLGDVEVVEIMANALDALVQGEVMQAKSSSNDLLDLGHYLRKSYYKTASLICNSCSSSALLAGHNYESSIANACERYGYHLGLAYQLVDDILDFTGSSDVLGKPAMADVNLGLATAPILYAAKSKPELKSLIKRRFKEKGDAEKALSLTLETDAVEQSYLLATFHAQSAVDAISLLPPSDARDGLINLAHMVLTRKS